MSLWGSKILYIFLDTTALARQRVFLEDVLGLNVVENEFHPPHNRHGVVKYDAGDTILALNVGGPDFDRFGTDGTLTVFTTTPMREAQVYAELHIRGFEAPTSPGGAFPDLDNHRYALLHYSPPSDETGRRDYLSIRELELEANDLSESLHFYQETLGLILLEQNPETATFATGNIRLVLKGRAFHDRRPAKRSDGYLIVFHTNDITESYKELARRGLRFQSEVSYSDIGGAARFRDPSGHVFCLYEPSAEALTWGSGAKVTEIIDNEKTPFLWQTYSDMNDGGGA